MPGLSDYVLDKKYTILSLLITLCLQIHSAAATGISPSAPLCLASHSTRSSKRKRPLFFFWGLEWTNTERHTDRHVLPRDQQTDQQTGIVSCSTDWQKGTVSWSTRRNELPRDQSKGCLIIRPFCSFLYRCFFFFSSSRACMLMTISKGSVSACVRSCFSCLRLSSGRELGKVW